MTYGQNSGGIDEIGGVEDRSPMGRAKMWQRMQDEIDRRDAEDAARAGQVVQPGQVDPTEQTRGVDPVGAIDEGVGAIAGALGGGLKAVLTERPEDHRMSVMAAMQAEALARLEDPEMADEVIAGVRASEGLDGDAQLYRQDELSTRKTERDLTERELQKGPDSLGKADDFVDRSQELEHRNARERLEDQTDRNQRRL